MTNFDSDEELSDLELEVIKDETIGTNSLRQRASSVSFSLNKDQKVSTSTIHSPEENKREHLLVHDNDDTEDEETEEEERGKGASFKDAKHTLVRKSSKKLGGSFQSMNLYPPIFKALMKKSYKLPTPIQRKVIPILLGGQDVVAMAKTGSGKTAAFVIPLLHKLKVHSAKVGARALILAPSRELAAQSLMYIKTLSKYTDLRAATLLGGDNINDQFDSLLSNPDIIVATPGRLIHILEETKMDLRSIQTVIFDEADRLFEMGLAPQIHEICSLLPDNRQTSLFSATLPLSLMEFAKAGLKDPQLIRLDVDSQLSTDLENFFFAVKTNEKEAMLLTLLTCPLSPIYAYVNENPGSSAHDKDRLSGGIIFVSTRHHVEYLHLLLEMCDISHRYLYGSMDPTARREALVSFRNKESPILIVTDVAARGLDLPYLCWVLHYDFPSKEKLFIHRAGRVARAGRPGKALSIVTPDDIPYLIDLSVYLGRDIIHRDNQYSFADAHQHIILGRAPRHVLDDQFERWQTLLTLSTDLDALKKVTLNAFQLYSKTRPSATPSSYEKTKSQFNDANTSIHIHPTWIGKLNNTEEMISLQNVESSKNNLLQQIQKYRPSETVFEAMKKNTKGDKVDPVIALMAKRRELMAKKKERQKQSLIKFNDDDEATEVTQKEENQTALPFQLTVQKCKETDFYLSYEKASNRAEKGLSVNHFAAEAREAVFDLCHDDSNDVRLNQRNRQVWDKKSKKFVSRTPRPNRNGLAKGGSFFKDKEDRKDSKTGEFNGKSNMKRGDFYKGWQKRRQLELPQRGAVEMTQGSVLERKVDYRNRKKKKNNNHTGNQLSMKQKKGSPEERSKKKSTNHPNNVRSELRRPEQVLKERKRKAREAERLSQRKKQKTSHPSSSSSQKKSRVK